MTEDADRSSRMKSLVTAAVGSVKSAVGKATEAVSGAIKKDDKASGATGITEEPRENAQKMKEAVEAALKTKPDVD